VIEEIVQLRSRVQATANLVFTRSVLSACKDGRLLSKHMVSQSFVGACMRAVCVRDGKAEPDRVQYGHKECLSYLQDAQTVVVDRMKFDNMFFDTDKGLTETMNKAAKEYKTVLHNNVWDHLIHFDGMMRTQEPREPTQLFNCFCFFLFNVIYLRV